MTRSFPSSTTKAWRMVSMMRSRLELARYRDLRMSEHLDVSLPRTIAEIRPPSFILGMNFVPSLRQAVGRRLEIGFGALPAFGAGSLQLARCGLALSPRRVQIAPGRVARAFSLCLRRLAEVMQLVLPFLHLVLRLANIGVLVGCRIAAGGQPERRARAGGENRLTGGERHGADQHEGANDARSRENPHDSLLCLSVRLPRLVPY